MDRRFLLLLLLFLMAAAAARVQGQPPGFVFIDCGIDPNASYPDPNGLWYFSDYQFVDTGVNYAVSSSYVSSNISRRFLTLRSFPEGSRNCYTFKSISQGSKYIIRATFLYGNYDSKNSPFVQFDLYLGVNLWKTINLTTPTESIFTETVSEATADVISVCLINTGHGTPFISGLDLRPLPNSLYPQVNSSTTLVNLYRIYVRDSTSIRYPADQYDRLWFFLDTQPSWSVTSTNSTIQNQVPDQFQPPQEVMQIAAYPSSSTTLQLSLAPDPGDLTEFYTVLYFSELQPNASREFLIYLNGALLNDGRPLAPTYLLSDVVFNSDPSLGFSECNITLVETERSMLPPIINAFEVFTAMRNANVASNSQDVDAMLAIKGWYQVRRNWMGDPCSPEAYTWNGLNCTLNNSGVPMITVVNLSYSGLTGIITTSFANLSALQYLDLSHNNLTGSIPDALGYLPSLRVLDLTDNQLSGAIPSVLLEKSQNGSLTLRTEGNNCLGGDSCEPMKKKKKKNLAAIISASVVSGVVGVCSVAIIIFCILKKRKAKCTIKELQIGGKYQLENRKFMYEELKFMTDNFSKIIGKGGFGVVYYGHLEDATEVAVKMLTKSSSQGKEDFLSEAEHLTRVHHKNLVSLVGYCIDEDHLALVCEFMPKGNLKDYLKASDTNTPLKWEQRLQIANDAAQGLEYLHTGCKPPLVHRDVKTANILLNERLEAKISDFGLTKRFQDDNTDHTSTRIVGTIGYLDPEYCNNNQLSRKSDVYSFGVVLLELITGKSPIFSDPEGVHIVQWVKEKLANGNIEDVIDTSLCEEGVLNSAWKAANAALASTADTSNRRPTMTEVVMELKECLAMCTNGDKMLLKSGSSEVDLSLLEFQHVGSISDNEGPSAR
ncbi:putative leucine-rich repeat receptor-like serine/threonine-protein kinase At2g19230 [Curcuma longa]|uniref:putative leucine-rich repeat receptor-like serine/threonine-protein kinase At2g19230 n=1 Tax=Curcuma longa TaxID=136217 RepID=UPI003D9EF554